MDLNELVCSKELSVTLAKLGIKQDSEFYWVEDERRPCSQYSFVRDEDISFFSAFTFSELAQFIPLPQQRCNFYKNENEYVFSISGKPNVTDPNLANCAAKMIISILTDSSTKEYSAETYTCNCKSVQGCKYCAPLVNHPPHYTSSKARCSKCANPVECIDVTRHLSFNIGNAIKYLWRVDLKNSSIEDLKKASWYIQDEIKNRDWSESNQL